MADKAIFFDRDDTLIKDPGFINHPDQVHLLEGVGRALVELRAMGYRLIVASNQSGVARGMVTEKTLNQIHERLKQLLLEEGASLDGIYYCPYHPEATLGKYRKQSQLRKPNPGMLLAAADELDIDLEQSWAIGDSKRDIEAGLRAGCRTILIENPTHDRTQEMWGPKPDFRAVNIKEAVNIIKKHHRSADKTEVDNIPAAQVQPQAESQTAGQPEPPNEPDADTNPLLRTEQLLRNILGLLKVMRRDEMFSEFSMTRLLAGVLQIAVLFCLLMGLWFLMGPAGKDNAVLTTLGFAVVLQLMALTFYVMQQRK